MTTKKVCRRTERSRSTVMTLLAAARDLTQNAIPVTKSRFGRQPRTTKQTDDLLQRELRKNHHLSASELKEVRPDHLGNVAVRCIQHNLQKDLNILSRHAASKPLLTPHMRNWCLQFALRYLHSSVDHWKKVLSSDESTFQCMSSSK